MSDVGFFERLDSIDALLEASLPVDLVPSLAELIKEPASARYVAEHPTLATREDSHDVLGRLATVLRSDGQADSDVVVDILESSAVALAASNTSAIDVPVPHSPNQLRALVKEVAKADTPLRPTHLMALLGGLLHVDRVDMIHPRDFARLVTRSLEVGGFAAAESVLAAAGFVDFDDERDGSLDWWRVEVLKEVMPALVDYSTERAFEFFLCAIEQLLVQEPSADMGSTLWHPTMEPAKDDGDWRSQIVDGLVITGDLLVRLPQYPGSLLLGSLWDRRHVLLKRAALWLAAQGPDSVLPFVEDRVQATSLSGTEYAWEKEYRDLLQSQCVLLSEETREAVVRWIRRGPELDHRDGLDEAQRSRVREAWIRDWMAVVEPILSPEAQRELSELRTRVGPESGARWERGVRSGFVRQVSPISAEDMLGWAATSVPDRIEEALGSPEMGQWIDFAETSREGLALAVAQALKARTDWLSGEASSNLARRPAARSVILEALTRVAWDDTPLEPSVVAGFITEVLGSGALSDSDQWASARVVDSLLSTDWLESSPLDRAIRCIEALTAAVSSGGSTDADDPAFASVNTPAGIATNVTCRTYLILRERNALSQVTERRMREQIRQLGERGAQDVHAGLGRWFSEFSAVDTAWADDLRSLIFPADNALFIAAWGSYVRYGRLRPGAASLLRHEYERVTDVELNFGAGRSGEEVIQSTTEHLLVLAAWGEIPVGVSGLLEAWFQRLTVEQLSSAHVFIARQAAMEGLSKEIRRRLQEVVDWRLGVGGEPTEFEHVGMWVEAPVDAAWTLELIARVGGENLNPMHGSKVLEFLSGAQESGEAPAETVIDIVAAVVRGVDGWRLASWEEQLRPLVSGSLQTEASRQAAELLHELGRRGLISLRPLFDQFKAA